jgi:hypothetical protein
VRRITNGDSRSFTEQQVWLLTCTAAGHASASTVEPVGEVLELARIASLRIVGTRHVCTRGLVSSADPDIPA